MRDVLGRVLVQAGYDVAFAETGRRRSSSPAREATPPPSWTSCSPRWRSHVLEELKEAGPRDGGPDDHRLRVDGDGHRRDQEGCLLLRPKPFDNQQLLHIWRAGSCSGAWRARTASCARRPCGTRAASWSSWARARRCSRSSSSWPRSPPRARRSSWSARAGPARSSCEGHPPELPASREALRGGELGLAAPRAARVEPLRPREGGVHRRRLRKKGLFELADKGTLFFDEIGNIPMETQAKLLRVIQEREFMRLGGWRRSRWTCGSWPHQRGPAPCGRGGALPRGPLLPAERSSPSSFRPCASGRRTCPPSSSTSWTSTRRRTASGRGCHPGGAPGPDGLRLPGNVRELENVIERGVVLATGPMIGKELVPEQVRASPGFFHIPPVSVPPEGITSARSSRLRAAHHRVHPRHHRRRAEGRGAAPGPQAHDPQRDDQAAQHRVAARPRAPQQPRRARGGPLHRKP